MLRMEKLSVLATAGIGGLLGGLLATCFLSGGLALASKEKVISAQRIEVVDGAGKVRGSFAVSGESGAVALTLLSNSGEPRAVVSAGADGLTSVALVHQGKLRAEMKIAAGGTPDLELRDVSGNPVFLQPKNQGVTTQF
jgi:hypothetical protein